MTLSRLFFVYFVLTLLVSDSALASEPTASSCAVPAPPFQGMSTPPPPPDYVVDPATPLDEITAAVTEAILVDPDPNSDGVLSICVEPGIYEGGVLLDATLLSTSGPMPSEVWLYSSGGRIVTEIDGTLGALAMTPRGIDIAGPGAPNPPTAPWKAYVRGFHVHDVSRGSSPAEASPLGPLSTRNWGGAGLRAQSVEEGTHIEWMIFSKNDSEYPGGALANFGGPLSAGELLIHQNLGGTAGGGAYLGKDVVAHILNSQFSQNEVQLVGFDRSGGGLAAIGSKYVHVEWSWFVDNVAWRGGGLWLSDVWDADITDVGFDGNRAEERPMVPPLSPQNGAGGGLGVRHSGFQDGGGGTHHQVRVTGGWFLNNEARGVGGGMYFGSSDDGEDVQILAVQGESNRAVGYPGTSDAGDGGAAWFDYPTVSVGGSTFRWNDAERSGGALFLTQSAVNVGTTLFDENVAGARGGGVVLATSGGTETAVLDQNEFRNNVVVGLPCDGLDCVDFDHGGGGLYTSYPGPLIRDSLFDGNRAGDAALPSSHASGGGLLAQAQTRVQDTGFEGNVSVRGIGGGVGCMAATLPLPPPFSVEVLGTSGPPGVLAWLDGNLALDPAGSPTAPYLGGGIGARLGCDVEATHLLLENNWAPKGGGIGGESIGITVSDSEIRSNGLADPLLSRPSSTWGGGVYALINPASGRDAHFDRVSFLSNEAANGGGGVATWSAACGAGFYEVTATDCEWTENTVTGSGTVQMPWSGLSAPAGGAWLNGGSDVSITGGHFGANTAFGAGGVGGAIASLRPGAACSSSPNVAHLDAVDAVFRNDAADSRGGAVYFEDNAATFVGGGFASNSAGADGGAIAGRLLGFGPGMDPVATLALDTLSLHENIASSGSGGAIHFNGQSLTASNLQVSENESASGPAIFGLAPGLVPSGATVPLSVDWQYVTVSGNWISGGLQHSAGVTFWDPVAAAPGRAVGFIDDSVVAFNHTPDPTKLWQVQGDQGIVWSNSLSYAHNPVETNPALLVQTTGGGVTGTNPVYAGRFSPGNSTLNLDPWNFTLYLWFDYHGDGAAGSPIVDPLSPTDDQIGAFAVGGAGDWCPTGTLVQQGCVPN